jgi:hypothetical protein
MMVGLSETPVTIYQSTPLHIPEDRILNCKRVAWISLQMRHVQIVNMSEVLRRRNNFQHHLSIASKNTTHVRII